MIAILNSNNGKATLSFELKGSSVDTDGKWLAINIYYSGTTWAISDEQDLNISMSNVKILALSLSQMCNHLDEWVKLPLDIHAKTPLVYSSSFGRTHGEILNIIFGKRDNVISGDKPVLSFVYENGNTKFDSCFVTDQTCIGEFSDNLQHIVEKA